MAKFSTHTFVHDGLVSHTFGPGEAVPEWAEGLVGAHVLVPESTPVPTDNEDAAEDATSEKSEGDGESSSDADGESDNAEDVPAAKPKAAAAPDFTGSAPRRRQSRK